MPPPQVHVTLRNLGFFHVCYTVFMNSVLFYTVVFGFSCGLFVKSFFTLGLVELVWLLLISFVLALLWSGRSKTFFAPYILTCSVFLFLFVVGAVRMEVAQWNEVQPYFESRIGTEITYQGVVVREPDERERSTHLYVKTEEGLLLVTTDRFSEVSYGDKLEITGTLSKPESFETDLGRTFNYPGYLRAKGISYVVSFADIKKIEKDVGNPVLSYLLLAKHSFMEVIESTLVEPQAGLSEGLLLGVKRALGEDLEMAFRKTGIIHIVVLSGYNIMLVVAFIMYVFSFFLPLRGRLVFGVIAIAAFACIVGLSATVVRASIMATLLLVARATGRTYAVLRALMITGLVMTFFNPYLLAFDTGFQLSFVATLGLILVAPHLEKRLQFMPTTIGLREFLTATLATQIFVMPILLYQIGEFSVVSVVVNLLVLPMVPLAMLLTCVTGIVGFFSTTIAIPFAFLAHVSLSYILWVAEFFAGLPFASYIVPAFPSYIVPVCYGVLAFVLCTLGQKKDRGASLRGWAIEEEISNEELVVMEKGKVSSHTPLFFK